jgi:hypothetical protein
MTITILPEQRNNSETPLVYQAQSGTHTAKGSTIGIALDALLAQLDDRSMDSSGTLVLLQRFHPDSFFNTAQQNRIAELMDKWRNARDNGQTLPQKEQQELETLVQTEVIGMAQRAKALLHEQTK